MQTSNSPQTTINSTVRDASVQIGEENKTFLILEGVMQKYGAERCTRGLVENLGRTTDAIFDLAFIIEQLTSPEKEVRQAGKKEVRRLVRIGKEATTQAKPL